MEHAPKVLLDSTILLSAHLAPSTERDACRVVLSMAEQGRIRAHICGHALSRIIEELGKALGRDSTTQWITNARNYLEVATTTAEVLDAALRQMDGMDRIYFDDAITMQTADLQQMEWILTLNDDDFATATTPIAHPQQLLDRLQQRAGSLGGGASTTDTPSDRANAA